MAQLLRAHTQEFSSQLPRLVPFNSFNSSSTTSSPGLPTEYRSHVQIPTLTILSSLPIPRPQITKNKYRNKRFLCYYFMCVSVFQAFVCVSHACLMPVEVRNKNWVPLGLELHRGVSYQVAINPESFARAVSVL